MRTTCTHPHNQARSGFVSNISSLFELATLANDSYWLAQLFDLITGLEPHTLGLSQGAIAFGVITAAVTALGSAYANSYHAEADRIEKGYAYAKLTRLQKMALLSDWIAHTADHAGPISLMINLATQNQLSRVSKLSIQAGTILFSAFISYSGVHSCKKAMLAFNDRSSDDEINTSQSCLSFLFKTCCGINESESYYIRHRNYNTI